MSKGYNEIVKSCKLVDYKLEFAANGAIWVEYWKDDTHAYRALFPEYRTSYFPVTYFTTKIIHEQNISTQ